MDDPRQHRGPGASARGGGSKKGGADQALGRSRGGFSTKIHIAVDALGNPVELILTAGQEADVTQAEAMIEARDADAYIADKAYDSDAVVRKIQEQGAEAVIPSKKNRKHLRDYDKHLYKERKKVEWFINLIKQFRRVATRYEKTGRNFLAFVQVASIMVLLR
jgi:transposase